MNNEFLNDSNNVNDNGLNTINSDANSFGPNNMEDNKPGKKSGKGKTFLLVLLISLILTAGILAGLYYTNIISFKKAEDCPAVDNNQQKCDVTQDDNEGESKELYFKNGNIIGDEQTKYNYELTQGIYDYGIWTDGFTGYQKTVSISIINPSELKTKFNFDDSYSIQSKYTLSFSKNVVDILAAYATNSIGSSGVFFFLMEDGTVEYLPIYKALSEKSVKSYGAIKDV